MPTIPTTRPRVLFVTDLAYPAHGRRYGDEDVWLTQQLRRDFAIALCHPGDAVEWMDTADVVVVRNSGPVIHHREAYDRFRNEATRRGTPVYNTLDGRGDMAGKQYLVDLSAQGYPVIPTVDRTADLDRLGDAAAYVVKPKLGADSIGLRIVTPDDVPAVDGDDLIQPRIDFTYEVSFYVVEDRLCYALHAPDPAQRWVLAPYEPTDDDLAFVDRFVTWNTLSHGVQRVDACRTTDGDLLLVELEDLNPYLSLDLVDDPTRAGFVTAMADGIRALLAERGARENQLSENQIGEDQVSASPR